MQDALGHAFGDTFPQVMEDDRDLVYFLPLERGIEPCEASSPISEFSEIPRVEVVHLLEGWIRIKRMLANQNETRGIEAMLLNFKLPCPRRNLECYRLYSGEVSDKKLLVIWGVETDENPCVPFEEALSLLLDLPLERMQQMLSRAMAPSNLDAANLSNTLAIRDHMLMEDSRNTNSSTFRWVVLIVFVLIAVGAFWLLRIQMKSGAYEVQDRGGLQSTPSLTDAFGDQNPPIETEKSTVMDTPELVEVEAVSTEIPEQGDQKKDADREMVSELEAVEIEEQTMGSLLDAMVNPVIPNSEH